MCNDLLGLIVFFISLVYISVDIMILGVETPGYFTTIAAILLLDSI